MMRGGSIVTTFIFSIIFLKIKVMKNQIAGAALALFGVMVVGFSNMYFSENSSEDTNAAGLQIVGYLLIILSLFTNGFLFVFEQKLLSKYHLEPLEVVGYEGMFGLGI
jgi:drug/metabolite transporter (DMT)-like permease